MSTSPTPSGAAKSNPESRHSAWRILGYGLIGVAGLLTLTALFFLEEDVRGKHALTSYYREAEARGQEMDLQKFIPAKVPDEENFAMTPFLAPLFDLNPQPLKPGEPKWRDKEGSERAFNFATNFNSDLVTKKAPVSVIVSGHMTDFDALAGKLKLKAGSGGAAQTVLDYTSQFQPVLDEIEAASHRPSSRFNVGYDDENPSGILLPHLAILKRMVVVLQVQAAADLALGRTDTAMKKVHLTFFLTDCIRSEPFLITQLVREAMLRLNREVLWEGLAENRWSDAQLSELQAGLKEFNLPKDFRRSLDSEVPYHAKVFDYVRKNHGVLNEALGENGDVPGNMFEFLPTGWLYLEEVSCHRMRDQQVLPGMDVATGRFYPREIEKSFVPTTKLKGHVAEHLWQHDVLATLMVPSLGKSYQKAAQGQTGVNLSIVACAVERYRLANKTLPGTLDELVPKYLDQVPLDVCNGKPLVYRPVSDRNFLLYSMGWNETDDGGAGAADARDGDWVWPQYAGK